MRTRLALLTLVLALGLLSPALTAQAAGVDTFHYSFKGQRADAHFSSFAGCVYTNAYVDAVDGRVKVDGWRETDSFAFVAISSYDVCQETLLVEAYGFTTLAPNEFQIDRQLSTAVLDTTIEAFDFVSGSSYTLQVDMEWSGLGELTREQSHNHFSAPGFKVNSRYMATSRDGNATGAISNGIVNFSAESALFARLSSVKSGDVVISH